MIRAIEHAVSRMTNRDQIAWAANTRWSRRRGADADAPRLMRSVRVCHEGTENQWVQVPPEHVSVQLGSYPGDERGQLRWSKPRRQKVHLVHRANWRAVTRVNPEQASKVRDVDADSALTGGRPSRSGEAPTHAATAVHRGSGSGTSGRFSVATWEVRSAEGVILDVVLAAAGRTSERPIVLRKPRNGGGGKGPHFWVRPRWPRTRRLA